MLEPRKPFMGTLWSEPPETQQAVPRFAFSHLSQTQPLCKREFWVKEFDKIYRTPLKGHSSAASEDSAQFVFVCCLRTYGFIYDRECSEAPVPGGTLNSVEEKISTLFMSRLPKRSPERPYLVLSWGLQVDNKNKTAWAHRIFSTRKDFLYLNLDLRGHFKYDEQAPLLPGVTMAPPLFWDGPKPDLGRPPRFFLTFRGSLRPKLSLGKWHCRMVINKTLDNITNEGVVIEFTPPYADVLMGGSKEIPKAAQQRYKELMDTSYALMLRGAERWSYRLSEAVGACAIPVFLADGRGNGHTMPFEELIDWRGASVHLGEILGMANAREGKVLKYLLNHPHELWSHLPSDPLVIRTMRENVCSINDRFFKTPLKRAEATLRSAAVVVSRAEEQAKSVP